jgi:hypothetical protein
MIDWEFIFWNLFAVFLIAFVACYHWPIEERVLAFQIWLYSLSLASIAGWLIFSAWSVASSP